MKRHTPEQVLAPLAEGDRMFRCWDGDSRGSQGHVHGGTHTSLRRK